MSATIETTTVPEVPVVTDSEEFRRDVLLRAAELIEERGWQTGSTGLRVSGPYCILGAVGAAMDGPLVDRRIYGQWIYDMSPIAQFLAPGSSWNEYTHWNDHGCPGNAKVARTLRLMANGMSFKQAISA